LLDSFLNETIPNLLKETTLISFLAVYIGGVITSVSPCVLSVVPVMVGFIGGYSQSSKLKAFIMSLAFVLGLGTTFALLGVIAVSMGTVFGRTGAFWYYLVAGISIVMGLNLIGVLSFQLPTAKIVPPQIGGVFGAYLVGLIFGVVASPCATPVLVAILALVSATGKLGWGTALLFVYGLGHGLPLLLVGTFTGAVKGISYVRRWTKNINYFSGAVLILIGLYFLYRIS